MIDEIVINYCGTTYLAPVAYEDKYDAYGKLMKGFMALVTPQTRVWCHAIHGMCGDCGHAWTDEWSNRRQETQVEYLCPICRLTN